MPGLSAASSGTWPGNTPTSPATLGICTESVWIARALPSGVATSSASEVGRFDMNSAAFHQALGLGTRAFDVADEVERLLGQAVDLTLEDHLERVDRLFERHVLARDVGECLGDEERLAQELLQLAGTLDGQLVVC